LNLTNQTNDAFTQQKWSFAPLFSKVNQMGTSVTYGIQNANTINALNSINAFNTNQLASGSFANYQQPAYNQFGYNNVNSYVSAGLYNQAMSGNFAGFQHYNPYGQAVLVQPAIDISETSSDVVVAACLPNVALNDISLNVTENSVSISANAWTGNQTMVFNRTVALPTSIRAESVDASLQSGILEIRLPKAEKSVRKRNTVSQENLQK
jgi:HSP20 family molecular chaperone IbpA